MLRMPAPPRFSRTDRDIWTGAAWNLLVVKTAAPNAGRSDVMNAKSGLDLLAALTPTYVAETLNPLGYVPDVGTYLTLEAGMEESTGAE